MLAVAEYLLSGCSPEGKKETVRIDAPSADLAVKQLQKRGYEEIVLHTDDVSAHYTHASEVENEITPAEFVKFRYFGSWLDDALFVAWKLYKSGWMVYGAALALLVFRRVMDWPRGLTDYAAAIVVAFPLGFSMLAQIFNPAHRYNRLIEALAWGHWEEVLLRLPRIRDKLPPEEGAFVEAQALAGLGRLNEAMTILKPFADDRQMPAWLYWGRLGDVYFAAGKPEMIVPAQEKALELAPDNPTVLLDLAMSLVRWRGDAARARDLLRQARTHALSDVLEVFSYAIEGMIELEDGNPAQARSLLEQTLDALTPFRHATPLIGSAIDRTCAYLALACAAAGDGKQAAGYYRRAEPRLHALRSTDLIVRCQQALRGKENSIR